MKFIVMIVAKMPFSEHFLNREPGRDSTGRPRRVGRWVRRGRDCRAGRVGLKRK